MNDKKQKSILVVDDQQMVADSLKLALNFYGYPVEIACNGQDALSRFQPGKFALVFTDFDMPGMNGHELASIIKARDPAQPIIMVTAYADGMDPHSLPQIDLILAKPWSLEMLRSAMNEIFGAV